MPEEIDRALAQVVALTGIAKTTLVRQALAAHLGAMGVIRPEVAEALRPVPTRGRGLATNRKKENR
ncbi:hypothetical protein DCE94_12385 [Agromyces badenianii]|nr:hypothetical protein DCE94_12385 [Agromyces badenianii]